MAGIADMVPSPKDVACFGIPLCPGEGKATLTLLFVIILCTGEGWVVQALQLCVKEIKRSIHYAGIRLIKCYVYSALLHDGENSTQAKTKKKSERRIN